LKALEICKKWTKEIEDKINKILDNQPENELCWKSWKPRNPRRLDAFWDAKF